MRTLKRLKNYREIARRVRDIVKEKYENARVIVFGSVVEGRITALSDIDLLIICDADREEGLGLRPKSIGGSATTCR